MGKFLFLNLVGGGGDRGWPVPCLPHLPILRFGPKQPSQFSLFFLLPPPFCRRRGLLGPQSQSCHLASAAVGIRGEKAARRQR